MIDCKFCDLYDFLKSIENECLEDGEEKTKYDYTIALVTHSWKPSIRKKKDAGRTVRYRHNGFGYKLNFCPECGRKLRRGKNENIK